MKGRQCLLAVLVAGALVSVQAHAEATTRAAPLSPGTNRLAPWAAFIDEASQRFEMPRAWIESVIMAESGGRTHLKGRPITSHAGAMGLMQLMPTTYQDMRIAEDLGADPYDPHDNILAGTAYLRAMYDRFGYPGLFGAYNAGPARFAASFQGGHLPQETRNYLARLTKKTPSLASDAAIFVTQKVKSESSKTPQTSALFVPLNPENSAEN